MRILLLSDTHGHIDEAILGHAREADEVWHAGDVGEGGVLEALAECAPVRAVYGNIDGGALRRELPLNLAWEPAGLPVLMTHIGGYPGRYTRRVRELIDGADPRPRLYVCGHSHICKVMPDRGRGLLHMNPGACGHHGFHKVRTMLRFRIGDGGRVADVAAIELGRRGRDGA